MIHFYVSILLVMQSMQAASIVMLHRKLLLLALVSIAYSSLITATCMPHIHADLFVALEGMGTAFTAALSVATGRERELSVRQIITFLAVPIIMISVGSVCINMSVSKHTTTIQTLDPILSPILALVSSAALAATLDAKRNWPWLAVFGCGATAVMLIQSVTVFQNWFTTPIEFAFVVFWCLVDFRIKLYSLSVNTPCNHTPFVFVIVQILCAAVLSPRWYGDHIVRGWLQVAGYLLTLCAVAIISQIFRKS